MVIDVLLLGSLVDFKCLFDILSSECCCNPNYRPSKHAIATNSLSEILGAAMLCDSLIGRKSVGTRICNSNTTAKTRDGCGYRQRITRVAGLH